MEQQRSEGTSYPRTKREQSLRIFQQVRGGRVSQATATAHQSHTLHKASCTFPTFSGQRLEPLRSNVEAQCLSITDDQLDRLYVFDTSLQRRFLSRGSNGAQRREDMSKMLARTLHQPPGSGMIEDVAKLRAFFVVYEVNAPKGTFDCLAKPNRMQRGRGMVQYIPRKKLRPWCQQHIILTGTPVIPILTLRHRTLTLRSFALFHIILVI